MVTRPEQLPPNCPCGSGKPWRKCCFDEGTKKWHKAPVELEINSSPTRHSNSKCIFSMLGDCGKKLTREHYVSRSILDQMPEGPVISGFPWQKDGTKQKVPSSSIAAKILCDRHNSILSPLDSAASQFFEIARESREALKSQEISQVPVLFLVSGRDLERWMLKVYLGSIAAKTARKGDNFLTRDVIKREWLELLLSNDPWPPGLGLHAEDLSGGDIIFSDAINFSPLYLNYKGDQIAAGASINISGFEFVLCLEPYKKNKPNNWHYHPEVLKINMKINSVVVGEVEFLLSW